MVYDSNTLEVLHELTEEGKKSYQKMLDRIHPLEYVWKWICSALS